MKLYINPTDRHHITQKSRTKWHGLIIKLLNYYFSVPACAACTMC